MPLTPGAGETLVTVTGSITAGSGETLVTGSGTPTAGTGETLESDSCCCEENVCLACPSMPPSTLYVAFFGGTCGLAATVTEGPAGVWKYTAAAGGGLPWWDEVRYQVSCVTVGGQPAYRVAAVYYLGGFPAGWSVGGDIIASDAGFQDCDPFSMLFSATDSVAWAAVGWGTGHDPCPTPPTSATVVE